MKMGMNIHGCENELETAANRRAETLSGRQDAIVLVLDHDAISNIVDDFESLYDICGSVGH